MFSSGVFLMYIRSTTHPHKILFINAKENNLLDKPGWIRFRKLASREKKLLRLVNSFEGIVGYLKSRNFNYFLIILDRSIAYHYNIAIGS